MAKVLFLASWYPGRVGAYDGDFIERHAQCISLYHRIFVVYIAKDAAITDGKIVIEKEISGNLITYRAYYPFSKTKSARIEKINSTLHGLKLFNQVYKMIVEEYGSMDIVHLNVLMKAGLYALRLNKKYKLPYVLSENWTGYYPEKEDGYLQQSWWYQFISKMIYRNCAYPLPVTKDLGERMNALMGEKNFRVIPNVVDTSLFYPVLETTKHKRRFIHASTLGYHKNIQGILNATKKLYQQRKDFELYLLGPASENIIHWTQDYGLLDTCIFFTGQIPYQEVASHLRKADAMVIFSRYENLPCVILEALTCGMPVISTDVGGIREVINDENGILIPSEQEDELLNAMNRMLNSIAKYDREKIALSAKNKFSFQTVGRQFDEVYKQVLAQQ